jgi:cellulose synthase/poly-beta-1,6-N-acetylglucosamine synthase-like glycosyltransferase
MAGSMTLSITSSKAHDAPVIQNPGVTREIVYTWLAIGFEALVSIFVANGLGRIVLYRLERHDRFLIAADLFFFACLGCLMVGSFIYQVVRLGYLYRLREHAPLTREQLESIYDCDKPASLAVLVPSYREEERVVRHTLMSAALMEYPVKRIALLIDDPPHSGDSSDMRRLTTVRRVPAEIDAMLREQEAPYVKELEEFYDRRRFSFDSAFEARRLAGLYGSVALWFETQAAAYKSKDHYDALYVSRILLEPAGEHRKRAGALEDYARTASLPSREAEHEYRRLAALFSARLTSFERKRYENLAHASNKAMNLNSYLGLLGKRLHEVVRSGRLHLVECESEPAQLVVPDADYVITVDADSMLLGKYALNLTHIMSRPESARFGVVQSPFSAVPGSPGTLERMAGAQTDVQWIASQGSTFFSASFWVGANALLRRAALEDICETVYERGYPIKRYIHDHTLVEDTESAIDLVVRGWQIYNHPERLSYSATPRDFGALVIQRRRWANGPLLIVPKLLRYAATTSNRLSRMPEVFLRLYGLTSVSSAIAMALMVAIPFMDNQPLPLIWLVLAAVPYYLLYARDLESCGYRWTDVLRMYSFNLLLIPVSISGMLKSLRQAFTGEPSPFIRTPKVPGRTAAPATYTLIPVVAMPWMVYVAIVGFRHSGSAFLVFGSVNVAALLYALAAFIRFRYGWEDVLSSLSMRFFSWNDQQAPTEQSEPSLEARRA